MKPKENLIAYLRGFQNVGTISDDMATTIVGLADKFAEHERILGSEFAITRCEREHGFTLNRSNPTLDPVPEWAHQFIGETINV